MPQNEHTPPRVHINFEMHTLSVIVIVSIFSVVEASWPDGTYCLPMPPNQKCPSGWQKGVRKHDTEDYQGSMHCHKKRQGWVPYNVDLCRNLGWGFCCKTRNYPRTGKTWPRGAYCIFRKGGTCPKSFDSGRNLILTFFLKNNLNNCRNTHETCISFLTTRTERSIILISVQISVSYK